LTGFSAIAAPPLTEAAVTNWQELGTWDDAYVLNDLDIVVVRRGDAFSLLSVTNAFAVSPLASTPAARGSTIVGAAHCDRRMWVFLQRTKDDPCAIDLADGNVVEFVTTAIRAPWRRGPEIQSRIIIPHAQAAIFMIGSSYFWLNLATGEHVRFKTDYSLDYFDEKQLVAVFTENGRPKRHRAVDMRTGKNVLEIPNQFKRPFIPFYWPDTKLAQPVQAYCTFPPDPNPRESLIGVSSEGRILPLGLGPMRDAYLATPRVREGHLAFRLREEYRCGLEPARLYVRQIDGVAEPILVSTSATDCILLTGGDCIYTTARLEPHGQKDEAWFRVGDGSVAWNLLEGIESLPPLSKSLADKSYVRDSMEINLQDVFGSNRHPTLTLCRFEHHQSDMRALALPTEEEEEHLGNRLWRRTMVVSRDRRILLPVLRGISEEDRPDVLWLHSSGRLIVGYYLWSGGGERRRTIRLRAIEVE
jgi:hypothetical protein